jgi:nucleotide-binding universal stress UspA family protein
MRHPRAIVARSLLDARGELTPGLILQASVPASLRGPSDDRGAGNRVGVMIVPLPLGEADPGRLLARIAVITSTRKRQPLHQPKARVLQSCMVRVMKRQRLVNLLVSNVPGPRDPLYVAGARIMEVFQIGAVQGNVTVNVGAFSYAGQLNLDVVADSEAVADLAIFTRGISDTLGRLGVLAPAGDQGPPVTAPNAPRPTGWPVRRWGRDLPATLAGGIWKEQAMAGIIVGVDGSPGAVRALDWAMKEAAAHHAHLTVVAVHEVPISGWTGNPIILGADVPELEKTRHAAEEAVSKAAAQLGDSRPASVTLRAANGFPAEELINASRDADLLVVGSRGVGGFTRLMMGSVSSQVVHHAHCPVVIVPDKR